MRNTNNTYKTQGGDNLVITVKENAPLLEYLINNVSESRSKLKATLQGRGIAVNGRMVTQFDYQLKAGDKIIISRHKKQNQFKSRYVKIVYEDRWLVVVEKNIGILSMAAGHSSLNVKSVLDDYFLKSRQKCRAHVVHRLDRYKWTHGICQRHRDRTDTRAQLAPDCLRPPLCRSSEWRDGAGQWHYRQLAEGQQGIHHIFVAN